MGLGNVEPDRKCKNFHFFKGVVTRQTAVLVVLDLSGMRQSKGGILDMVREFYI